MNLLSQVLCSHIGKVFLIPVCRVPSSFGVYTFINTPIFLRQSVLLCNVTIKLTNHQHEEGSRCCIFSLANKAVLCGSRPGFGVHHICSQHDFDGRTALTSTTKLCFCYDGQNARLHE
ncbi:uncharacterized protein [Rhodnius prolixus]|uniref:uncharacterized protein n=1 Tax=Rhodnius prolixus TaxID=13249 RepID=UPI003D18BE74